MPPMRSMRPNGPQEKGDIKSLKKLLVYCKRYLPLIIVALLLAGGGAVMTIIGPQYISKLTDAIKDGVPTFDETLMQWVTPENPIDISIVKSIGVTLIVIYGVGAIVNYAQTFIMASITQYTSRRLRRDISEKINILPLRYFDSSAKGDTLSRVTNDVDMISQTLSSSIANMFSALVLFVGVTVMMFVVNPTLAAVTIGTSFIGFICMMFIVKASQKYFNRKQKDLGVINGQVEEVYTNHNIVLAFGAKGFEVAKFEETNGKLFDSNWKSQFLSGMMPAIMQFVGKLAYALIFVVGISLVIGGSTAVTLGTIASFIIYANLFSQPLSTIAQSMTSLQQASAASKRVFEMLDAKEMEHEDEKTAKLETVVGDVEFRNVKFGYTPEKTIIHNFSADLKRGQKVAIVGPTGAGKTTMVNLLMRFYEIDAPRLIVNGKITDHKIFNDGHSIRLSAEDNILFINGTATEYACDSLPKGEVLKFNQNFDVLSGNDITNIKIPVITGRGLDNVENIALGVAYYGDIFIDNIPVNAMKRENVHDLFDMILQDTWLFEGTIRENLVYNKEGVTDAELDRACAAVGLKHFIETMPQGYDTKLDESLNLSEGQKQQLTIARAMVKDAPLLILDEATSSVDTRTELVIQEAMDKLTEGRTSFVIAHRLSTIRNADIILVMRDGDIVEQGNHEQLLAQKGFYAELYNSQFAAA